MTQVLSRGNGSGNLIKDKNHSAQFLQIRFNISNRNALCCMSIELYGKSTIGVHRYDIIGALSSWLKFIWFIDQF
jgi:hypothetical protein